MFIRLRACAGLAALAFMSLAVANCAPPAARPPAGEPIVKTTASPPPQADTDAIARKSEVEASGWSGSQRPLDNPELIAAGKLIAERECASCHAVDKTSKSPLATAPPLRNVLGLYEDADRLETRFIEGMRVGHDEMPLFDFDIAAADALIAYLETITDAGAN